MEYPQMIRVRQTFDDTTLDNVSEEINTQLANLKLETAVKPGQTAAVACSSRGIDNYGVIVKAVISYLKQFKLEPFIIPAMGSHGAATAAGQKRVLEHLGIVEEEADEAMFWMETVVESNIVSEQLIKPLLEEANEILSIIVATIRTARSNLKK